MEAAETLQNTSMQSRVTQTPSFVNNTLAENTTPSVVNVPGVKEATKMPAAIKIADTPEPMRDGDKVMHECIDLEGNSSKKRPGDADTDTVTRSVAKQQR